MAKTKTIGKGERAARKKLQTYVYKYLERGGSILQIANGSNVHSQTIVRFLEKESILRLDKWDDIVKFMDKNPIK